MSAFVPVALPDYILAALTAVDEQTLLDAIVRYGVDCRNAALEAAAKEIETYHLQVGNAEYVITALADAIRAMKEGS